MSDAPTPEQMREEHEQKRSYDPSYDPTYIALKHYEAEIPRLRAALEEIAGMTPSRSITLLPIARQADHYWNVFVRCRRIAAAALKPQP